MEHEVNYDFDHEDHFWHALDEIISRECENHTFIDDTLRSYLAIISSCRERFLPSDHDLGRCAFKLQDSPLFSTHSDYIRRQFVQCLIEDDEPDVVLVSTTFLLADAQTHERTYELLNDQGAFPRLVDLIQSPQQHGHEGIHRLLMELLYEMSRIQTIKSSDLAHIGDDFVKMLFEIIEQVSDDVEDPYHYPTIRVLLVLNEQFMVAAHEPSNNKPGLPLTNKVIKVLSLHGSAYKTFGENIILLLNREDETSLQLLTLKLLYLLFTTPPTYEYFYTNDLHVLVDILVRNLLDLPEEASSLRHTYLRVLYPLLEHTQLQFPPHYKRDEIRKLLLVLGGGHLADASDSQNGLHHWGHFEAVDETTKRLVKRCEGVSWLIDPRTDRPDQVESPTAETNSNPTSPISPVRSIPPELPAPRKLKKRNSSKASTLTIGQYLTPQLEGARHSSLSMMEVAAQTEKPGVITPSRNPGLKHNLRAAIMHNKKERPPPPQARRSDWTRMKAQRQPSDAEVATVGVADLNTKIDLTDQKPPALSVVPEKMTKPHQNLEKVKEREQDKHTSSPIPRTEPPPNSGHHHHIPHYKKPPPMPKARRWRGKRGKEDNESGSGPSGPRVPGRFNPNLPSIVTTSSAGEQVPTQSPFSPLEKNLSPPEPGTDDSGQAKSSVSQALEKAQASVVEAITETMEQVDLAVEAEAAEDNGPKREAGGSIDSNPKRDSLTETSSMQGEEPQHFHDALLTQPLTEPQQPSIPPPPPRPPMSRRHTGASAVERAPEPTVPQPQPQPQPRVVLTPPGQEPSRGVPGPQIALERSPFLTDEEDPDSE
ncbi:uncharacterized protein A1O9_00621 [Exophiala aquamarina CBS 119918]|uniref:SPIN90/Ldb17 leucine-rich domain-containing protein n=1 Tax=Exophiala aquamarina CBS 119918 TaxID=1182545 RepID=A0A072PTH3_9EURO|nr:uncharacterized protein A1O9_00621 [Exophiala aquamarina CBS 119918]KEF62648.1 hypothetical protein A1O9_00621 [Exophiala aquamarina CBS 119918]